MLDKNAIKVCLDIHYFYVIANRMAGAGEYPACGEVGIGEYFVLSHLHLAGFTQGHTG